MAMWVGGFSLTLFAFAHLRDPILIGTVTCGAGLDVNGPLLSHVRNLLIPAYFLALGV